MKARHRRAEHHLVGDVIMIRLASALAALVRSEEGATMVEYALMLAGIAVLCVGVVKILGGDTSGLFNEAQQGW